jgi:hypothetical protein
MPLLNQGSDILRCGAHDQREEILQRLMGAEGLGRECSQRAAAGWPACRSQVPEAVAEGGRRGAKASTGVVAAAPAFPTAVAGRCRRARRAAGARGIPVKRSREKAESEGTFLFPRPDVSLRGCEGNGREVCSSAAGLRRAGLHSLCRTFARRAPRGGWRSALGARVPVDRTVGPRARSSAPACPASDRCLTSRSRLYVRAAHTSDVSACFVSPTRSWSIPRARRSALTGSAVAPQSLETSFASGVAICLRHSPTSGASPSLGWYGWAPTVRCRRQHWGG